MFTTATPREDFEIETLESTGICCAWAGASAELASAQSNSARCDRRFDNNPLDLNINGSFFNFGYATDIAQFAKTYFGLDHSCRLWIEKMSPM